MAVNNFDGTAVALPIEEPFRMEDWTRKQSIPTTPRPSATEFFLENTDLANDLDYSLDGQVTWTTLVAGAQILKRGRIRNARNSVFIRRNAAANATYAGWADTEG